MRHKNSSKFLTQHSDRCRTLIHGALATWLEETIGVPETAPEPPRIDIPSKPAKKARKGKNKEWNYDEAAARAQWEAWWEENRAPQFRACYAAQPAGIGAAVRGAEGVW